MLSFTGLRAYITRCITCMYCYIQYIIKVLNTRAHYKRALAPPPNFEFTRKIKMADHEENSKHLVFVILIKSNKTY